MTAVLNVPFPTQTRCQWCSHNPFTFTLYYCSVHYQ